MLPTGADRKLQLLVQCAGADAQTAFALVLRQYRPLASGAEGQPLAPRTVTFGSPLGFHCTAAWPWAASRPPSFLRTAGAARGVPLGAAAPGGGAGRSGLCSVVGALVPHPPGLWALGPRPPPGSALGSVAGGPPPGPWGSRGGRRFCPLVGSAGRLAALLPRFFSARRPLGSPLLRRLRRRFFSDSGDVAF